MELSQDFKEFIESLNVSRVRYLVVGGYAVALHGHPRYTKDLDVWVEASPINASKVFAALRDFGAPLDGLTESDFEESGFYQMGRPPGRIDVMMSIDGVEFDTAWKNRTLAVIRGVSVHFIGKDDLIHNKELAGRYQDLADIEKIRLKKS